MTATPDVSDAFHMVREDGHDDCPICGAHEKHWHRIDPEPRDLDESRSEASVDSDGPSAIDYITAFFRDIFGFDLGKGEPETGEYQDSLVTELAAPSRLVQFEAFWQALVRREQEIHDAKRNDYTGGDADPLSNYRHAAEAMGVSTALGMTGRLQEKVTRLSSLLKPGVERRVSDETLVDTCVDIAIIAKLIAIESLLSDAE